MPTPPLTRLCEFRTSEGSILVPYALQRRRGMRYLRVSVDAANAVNLRVPYRISETQAVEFLQSQADWVLKMLARVPRRITLREFLEEQRWITADGRRWTLRWSWSSRHPSLHLAPESGEVEFRINPALPLDPQIANVLRAMGRTVLPARSSTWRQTTASLSGGSPSATNAAAGAPARTAAPSRSTGACCCSNPNCRTTSSCTSWPTSPT